MRALLAGLLILSTPAWSQDRPLTQPSRDVDVTYRSGAGDGTVEQRSRFAVASQTMRIDTPSPGLYVIVNRAAHTMSMVSDSDRGVVDLPYDPARSMAGVPSDQSFRRGAPDTVAGLACTEWDTADAQGRALTLCFTADGVLLRLRAGATVLVQATKVVYGPIDPVVFAAPAGYGHVSRRATP